MADKTSLKIPFRRTAPKRKDATLDVASASPPSVAQRILDAASGKQGTQGLIMSVSPLVSTVTNWIDLGSPSLNSVFGDVGKGMPGGRIVELYGGESVGKTALGYFVLATCQRLGGLAVLADIEASFDPQWAALLGVDVNTLLQIQLGDTTRTVKGKQVVSLEGMEDLFSKFLWIFREFKTAGFNMPMVVLWDSVAGTPTRKELDGDFGEDAIAGQARVLSAGLRKLYSEVKGTAITLICINQTRTKIGAYYAMDETPGGKALKFYATIRANIRKTKQDKKGLHCKVVNRKNKVSFPLHECDFQLDFNRGVIL